MTTAFLKEYEDFPEAMPRSSDDSNTIGNAAHSANRNDGLRGLAALTVFIQHYGGKFSAGEHEFRFGQQGRCAFVSLPFERILRNGGNASVTIFFVLSGYELSLGHLHRLHWGKNENCRRSLLRAAVRRPIRLYVPPLMVSASYALLLHLPGPLVLPVPWLAPQGSLMAEVSIFVRSSFQFFKPFRAHDSELVWYRYNMVMWTIPIELKGSILVFVEVVLMLSRARLCVHDRRRTLSLTWLARMPASYLPDFVLRSKILVGCHDEIPNWGGNTRVAKNLLR